MKVSLIYARSNTSLQVPLGLLWIAAVLEKAGHSVQVIDPLPRDEWVIQRVKDFAPNIVGLNAMTTDYRKASQLTRALRKEIPGALYCMGGAHASALPTETSLDLNLDFVVVGEGEYTMLEVCDRLEKGQAFNEVEGLAYRQGGEVVINPHRKLIEDLDELPLPARHLLNMEWYLTPPGLVRGAFLKRTLGIMATRGCPFDCIFCGSKSLFGRRVRQRSVESVIEEIEMLRRDYRIDGFYLYDDTFTIDVEYTLAFCQALQEKGLNLKWGCQAHVNTVSREMLREMKASGCIQVDVGVESGSEKVLKNLKKGSKPEAVKRAFTLIHESGIRAMATFVLGSPGETAADIEETRKLAKEIRPDHIKFFYLTPFPGSELYKMAQENDWLDQDVEFSSAWQIRQTDDPVMTINFTREQLRRIRASLQNEFLLRNYVTIAREWRFAPSIALVLLRHPYKLFRGLIRVARTRRIDNIIELGLELYRIGKAIEIQKKPGG